MMMPHYLFARRRIGLLCITFVAITFVFTKSNDSQFLKTRRSRKLENSSLSQSFADTFPNRFLVVDLMQLSKNIYDVDDEGVSPEETVSILSPENPTKNFELKFWVEAEFSTEAMIVTRINEESSTPIIVFRGSEEPDDWTANLNFLLETSEFINAPASVMIHRGFQSALFDQDITSQLENELLQLIGEDGDVIVTGHSLG
jgi:hypothetical protein